jgi:molybdopterin converting factor small subunit
MRVRVLFFGVLKDLAGRSSEDAEFADGADLRAVLNTGTGYETPKPEDGT